MNELPKLDIAPGDPVVVYIHTNLVGEDICTEIENEISESLTGADIRLIFSLGQTKYMSSAGVALLIKLMTKMRIAGGDLVLCNLQPSVENLLEITKLTSVFKIAHNLDAAHRLFQS